MKLTPKQKRFVEEYLVDLNATQAAIRAGYSEKTAEAIGHENLRKPKIKMFIDEALKTRAHRAEISADKVLQELAAIAFANATDVVNVKDVEYISSYKWMLDGEEVERNDYTPSSEEYERMERVPVMEIRQSVFIKETEALNAFQKKAISGMKETKYGIEIKFHDKVRAIELLGKHLGLFTDKVEHSGTVTNHNIDMSALGIEELKKLAKLDE
ncbi:terminase small subunit [Bacillus sp. ILBB4]|nr:terminase small subunit [Bacillus sp. ILBB4]